jgi:hypothetical protein
MDVKNMTLADFLLARITEQEHRACSASALNGPVWTAANGFINGSTDTNANPRAWPGDTELWDDEGALNMHPATAEFIAANDPRHVLAECEAKRRIVDAYQHAVEYEAQFPNPDAAEAYIYEHVIQVLALPYAAHEDFREEWRP